MRKRSIFLTMVLMCAAASTQAVNPVLGEIEIVPASSIESDAGVWLDGQYVGYVKNLRGGGKLVLVPGEHELQFKLIGYQDVTSTVIVEPGEEKRYRVTMFEQPDLTYPSRQETAKLRIEVEPEDAAVFVDNAFVGHVDRFNGPAGMRLKAGTYRFTIALPGYQSFETELTLRAGQTYEIKTDLPRGGYYDQGDELSSRDSPEIELP
jgi:hypothetical protein